MDTQHPLATPAAPSRTQTGILAYLGSATVLLALASGAALIYIARATSGAVGLQFSDTALQDIANVLTPLVLVSLFLERAVEVVVSAWRNRGANELREGVNHAQPGSQSALFAARALQTYRVDTMRIAFITSFSLAFFAALVGVRAVYPLLNDSVQLTGTQALWFNRFDIIITALLLGGGADGIHQIISTFTDFLEKTRNNLQSPTPAQSVVAAPAVAPTQPVVAAPAVAPAQPVVTVPVVAPDPDAGAVG